MVLKANQYPDIYEREEITKWDPPETWVDPFWKVDTFLDLFLKPAYFGRIIVWKNSFLRNYRAYKIPKGDNHLVIDTPQKCIALRRHIENSCDGSGSTSILFVPLNPEQFIKELMEFGHYGKPTSIIIGSGEKEDPLDPKRDHNVKFLESELFSSGERILTFAHDIEFLYEIFRD